MLDGEIVLLRDGLPDLAALLGRHQLVTPRKIWHFSRACPVKYVVFDVLCHRSTELLSYPFGARREVLEQLFAGIDSARLMLSPAVVGCGRALFTQAVAAGHEGIMAKHLSGPYLPGRRSAAWQKIKPQTASRRMRRQELSP